MTKRKTGEVGRPHPYSQSVRVINILEILIRRGNRGVSLREIASQFEVSSRTVVRDFQALQEAEIPLAYEFEDDGQADRPVKYWRLIEGYKFGGK